MRFSRLKYAENLSRFLETATATVHGLSALSQQLVVRPDAFTLDTAERLRDMAELLQALFSEFELLAHLEGCALPPASQVNLRDAAMGVAGLFQEFAEDQDIDIAVVAPADLVIHADREWCVQLLRRLVDNAIRYNRMGGRVLIVGRRRPDGSVELSVGDSGGGLSMRRLTQPFRPMDRDGKDLCPTDGLGMGLAIAYTIARRQGARIRVRSRAGRGTIFTILWPPESL
jgi:two-component system, OmpR family, phosphate regulon sensor histidine kinase PhoR